MNITTMLNFSLIKNESGSASDRTPMISTDCFASKNQNVHINQLTLQRSMRANLPSVLNCGHLELRPTVHCDEGKKQGM